MVSRGPIAWVSIAGSKLASVAPDDPNNVTAGNSLLWFEGFIPSVQNKPGLQIAAFSFYRVGSNPSSTFQAEQFGAYAVESADPALKVEQFGAYICGIKSSILYVYTFNFYSLLQYNMALQVEQFGAYVSRSEISPLQVAQLGYYILGKVAPVVIPALASSSPETPITEVWAWTSDKMISDDGGEQRISLSGDPRRNVSTRFAFVDGDEVRLARKQLTYDYREQVAIPLHQYGTRLKAVANAGATYLTFTPTRTDLRDDGWVLIVEGDKYELKTVDTIDGTGCSITTALANAYTKKARVMPVMIGLIDKDAALVQYNANNIATLTVKGIETETYSPFLRPGITVELAELGGLPILERRANGTDFNDIFDVGREMVDFGGKIDFRQAWNYTRISGEREYVCQRVLDPDDWDYWRVFFDYCKGSVNPFFLPTYREDFDVITYPTSIDNILVVAGHDYTDHYFDDPTYKQIAIFAEDGSVHYATIADAIQTGANDNLEISPGLPPTFDGQELSICLLLRARLGTDEVNLEHEALHTTIKTSIRTVDA